MNQEQSLDVTTVSVVGLGKIGLTLAAVFSNRGFRVIGIDINENVVQTVNQGKSHIMKEPGLDYLVYHAHKQKTLTATTNTKKAVGESDIIVVIVPVLLDEHNLIDYQWIDLAVENIAKGDRKSTRLNSSHVKISYAVFCLKKKMQTPRKKVLNEQHSLPL